MLPRLRVRGKRLARELLACPGVSLREETAARAAPAAPHRNAQVIEMTLFQLRIMAQVLPFLLVTPGLVMAQTAPTRSEARAALDPAATPAPQYTPQHITQGAPPTALYPTQPPRHHLLAT